VCTTEKKKREDVSQHSTKEASNYLKRRGKRKAVSTTKENSRHY
jgi:hypothetical protein